MDKTAHEQIVADRIEREMETLYPHGEGQVPSRRVQAAMQNVAQVAFREGQSYALLSLMTVADVAAQFKITERRVRAIAADRHARHGIGWRVPGTRVWLFRPEELDLMRPAEPGRPKGSRRNSDAKT